MEVTKNDILNEYNLNKLISLTKDEGAYREFMQSLRKTRNALYTLMERRPDLYESIKPQFESLNNLIGALLPDDYSRIRPPFF